MFAVNDFYLIHELMNWLNLDENDPYPDAIVSFWRLNNSAGPNELIYVGALIQSNCILVPRDSLNTLKPFKNIGLCIGRSYKTHSPIIPFAVEIKEIPKTDKFIILVVSTSA